jgi:protein-S-isoprenylcysteine O-methyltransferase Ste14
MTGQSLFNDVTVGWFVIAAMTFFVLLFVDAPYGRHIRRGWGPTIPNKVGWVVMEMPIALVFAACFLVGKHTDTVTAWVFLGLWEAHYVHRTFIYPLRLRGEGKQMPLLIVGIAFVSNVVCGYVNGHYLFTLSGGYRRAWLGSTPFLAGLTLFVIGYVINRQSDQALRGLRKPGEDGYKIPHGGLYRWVSCPNYLGEIIEWCGWAVATWSLAGLAFAVWTAANLLPRARAHHTWYQENFPEYPPERKALLPGLW